ncbi:MAG: hypothetical protein OIF38_00565, partial [Cellvibrionaceae bacterium]|nr:hypothetical protein [Cellvibrionaceae bacterium]
MRSEAEEILQAARAAVEQGAKLCLITVVASYGSSPRPPGSFLVLSDDGRFWGSVSGGCIEEDLLERLQDNFPAQPELRSYGASDQERQRLQLPCGGQLTLLLQPLSR